MILPADTIDELPLPRASAAVAFNIRMWDRVAIINSSTFSTPKSQAKLTGLRATPLLMTSIGQSLPCFQAM